MTKVTLSKAGGGGGTSIPVSATPPASPAPDTLWFDETVNTLKRWNGDLEQWEYAVGNPSAMVPLQRFVADALGLADFDFTSIPGTYAALHIVLMGRSTASLSIDPCSVQFNGDATANYDYVRLVGTTSAAATTSTAQTAGLVGYVPGSLGHAQAAGAYVIDIPAYTNTTFSGQLIGNGGRGTDLTTGFATERCQVFWRSPAAITRVRLFPPGGQWAPGSTATLYGVGTP